MLSRVRSVHPSSFTCSNLPSPDLSRKTKNTANQNTHAFGRVDERDGIWRDSKDRSLLEDTMGSTRTGGIGAVARGLVDAVRRVQ